MTNDMSADKATALRKPFPPESVGKLPKGGVMLDYVGHAAVTDRLLAVDPYWSWEPMALDQFGSPQCDRDGNLWIKLTICGVTRLGVGDGKSMKERVGDAIRNAAMRFGVALDLWAKENLVEFAQQRNTIARQEAVATEPPRPAPEPASTPAAGITKAQLAKIGAAMRDLHITDRDNALVYVSDVIGRTVESRSDLTKTEAGKVIEALDADLQDGAA